MKLLASELSGFQTLQVELLVLGNDECPSYKFGHFGNRKAGALV